MPSPSSRPVGPRARLRGGWLLVALIVSMFAAPAFAQDEAQDQAHDAAASPIVELGEVSRRFDRAQARLADDVRGNALRADLGEVERWLQRDVQERGLDTRIGTMDRLRLDELLRSLARQRAVLSRIEDDAGALVESVAAIDEEVRATAVRWERVREDLTRLDVTPEVEALVERVDSAAQRAETTARDRLAAAIALQARTLSVANRVAALSAEGRARQRVLAAQLFARDHPPLLPGSIDRASGSLADDVAAVGERIGDGFDELTRTYAARPWLQLGIGIVVLVLVFVARRSATVREQEDLESVRRALTRPVAVAVVLTLALTQSMYPTAATAVVTTNTAAFVVAEVFVLAAMLGRGSLPPLAALGTLLVAAQFALLVPHASIGQRIVVLIVGLVGTVLLARLAHRARRHPALQDARARSVVVTGLLVSSVALAMAVVANVFGWLALALALTRAVTTVLLAALGVSTLVLVVRDLLGLLLLSRPAQRLRSVRRHAASMRARLRGAVTLAGVVVWIWAAVAAFDAMDVVASVARWIFGAGFTIGQTTIVPGTVLVFALAIWLAVVVSRVIRFFLEEDLLPRLSLPRGVPGTISATVNYVIIAVAILFATTVAGFDLTKLTIVLGALGVGIGFGLQNIINNFMSGLILLFERPIQVGDNVQVGALMGIVKKIGIRASIVRTYEGSEVIVPNGDLISQQVINYTLSDRHRRLEFLVGVAYGSDVDRVIEVLREAVTSVDRVVEQPAPLILFEGFGDSSLDFRTLFWIADFDDSLPTRSDVGRRIERALAGAGFQIPFPQRDVYIKEGGASPRS